MSRRGWRRVFRLDVGREHLERDVDEEIAFHLDMRAGKLAEQGWTEGLARGQARLRFGDLAAIRRELVTIDRHRERDMRRGRFIEHLRRDLGYALRALRHHAGFSLVVVCTLALGIGANTAIFSLVDALLLRSLPVPHPEQLVAIGDVSRVNSWSRGSPRTDLFSYPLYRDLRDHNTVFSGLYANSTAVGLTLQRPAPAGSTPAGAAPTPDEPAGRFVSANYFRVLQVNAARGRVFRPDEDAVPGAGAVLVISDGYWEREFNRDPDILGRTVSVNHVPLTVVGIMPPSFPGDIVAQRTDLWIPITMEPVLNPTRPWLDDRSANWMQLMGRLKPGITLVQARDEITALTRRLLDQGAQHDTAAGAASRVQYDNVPIASGARGFSYWRRAYAPSLYILQIVVGLVLVIVCANVANLLLGRAAARGREIGVRLALGAGRARLVQQLMVESVMFAVVGAALGLLVARWGTAILLHAASGDPRGLPVNVHLSGSVLGFIALLAVATAMLFGLVPALRATRVDVAGVLRANTRGINGGWRRLGTTRALVVLQVALSLVMLAATGMLVRSLRALETQNLGLNRDHLLIVSVNADRLQLQGPALRVLRTRLVETLGAIPGVTTVSYSMDGIFGGVEAATSLRIPGFDARTAADSSVSFDAVGPGYFHAIGTRILRGRDIAADDIGRVPTPVVVNGAFVKKFLAGGDALGRHFDDGDRARFEVVGVSEDARDHSLREAAEPRLYTAMGDGTSTSTFAFELLAAGDPARLVEPVRRALRTEAPSLHVDSDRPLAELTRSSIRQDILMARFVSGFGVLALVLAAMGLYGIMSYATLRRTGEFGLRMALGAQPSTIMRMVLRDGLTLIGVGVLAGVPLLIVGTHLLRNQLFGVGALDWVSIGFAIAVLGVSALAAGLLPARRAARVGPLVALQTE